MQAMSAPPHPHHSTLPWEVAAGCKTSRGLCSSPSRFVLALMVSDLCTLSWAEQHPGACWVLLPSFCSDSQLFGITGLQLALCQPLFLGSWEREVQPWQREVSSAFCGFTAALRLRISTLEARSLRGSVWHTPPRRSVCCPDVLPRYGESHVPFGALHPAMRLVLLLFLALHPPQSLGITSLGCTHGCSRDGW